MEEFPSFEVKCLRNHFNSSRSLSLLIKLVDPRSVETVFLRGLRYANVSLTLSGVDTVRN